MIFYRSYRKAKMERPMLENKANVRLLAGVLIALLAIFATVKLVRAQSPTPPEAASPTP